MIAFGRLFAQRCAVVPGVAVVRFQRNHAIQRRFGVGQLAECNQRRRMVVDELRIVRLLLQCTRMTLFGFDVQTKHGVALGDVLE